MMVEKRSRRRECRQDAFRTSTKSANAAHQTWSPNETPRFIGLVSLAAGGLMPLTPRARRTIQARATTSTSSTRTARSVLRSRQSAWP